MWKLDSLNKAQFISFMMEKCKLVKPYCEECNFNSKDGKRGLCDKLRDKVKNTLKNVENEDYKKIKELVKVMPEKDKRDFTMKEFESEKHTCLRRTSQIGPWDRSENLDTWEKRGKDRVCSFCGSMHPDEFLKFCKDVDGINRYVLQSDRKNKFYIRRPEVNNAGEGAIKFYLHHSKGFSDEEIAIIKGAIELSNLKGNERMKEYKQKLKKLIEEDKKEE